jgi:hypothetical protein
MPKHIVIIQGHPDVHSEQGNLATPLCLENEGRRDHLGVRTSAQVARQGALCKEAGNEKVWNDRQSFH